MKLSDFQPEIDALKKDGYEIIDRINMDYGLTLGLVVKKNDEKKTIMLRECFYDTDSKGNRTTWHGVIDIRDTPWSKELRA